MSHQQFAAKSILLAFKKGDYIITSGVEGKISDINFMFTTLITNDNKKITMPNSDLLNNSVTNLGAFPKRRVDFMFSAAYESDVETVKKIITDVMASPLALAKTYPQLAL